MYTIDLDVATLDNIIEQADRRDMLTEDLSEYQDVLSELEVEVVA